MRSTHKDHIPFIVPWLSTLSQPGAVANRENPAAVTGNLAPLFGSR